MGGAIQPGPLGRAEGALAFGPEEGSVTGRGASREAHCRSAEGSVRNGRDGAKNQVKGDEDMNVKKSLTLSTALLGLVLAAGTARAADWIKIVSFNPASPASLPGVPDGQPKGPGNS